MVQMMLHLIILYITPWHTYWVASTVMYVFFKFCISWLIYQPSELLLFSSHSYEHQSILVSFQQLQSYCTFALSTLFTNQLLAHYTAIDILKNRVKQGAILSPILFAVYLGPLIKRIRNSNDGCLIGEVKA